ncbi:NAD(P)/FAD-dependent oxidoreductase [Actinomadura flavalba]|uniref:NAD(P)/FAD-dependent oxidoreductase n=1 Tax=Actinomadura flavalba TaxID=1120938 RepID=UPI00035C394A|nr:FAD-dependent oxidoreductase [Actinomadura flavalba]
MSEFDVGVIGAGVHGAGAAYHLARRGLRTAVFERGAVASGPTGRSSGICRAYYTDPFLAEVAAAGLDFLASFRDRTGGESGYRRTGGLYLHGSPDVPRVTTTVEGLRALGVRAELLTPAQLARRFPGVDTTGVAIAVWEPDAGTADPYLTTTGLARAAARHGAALFTGREVVGLDETGHGVTVTTSDGAAHTCDRLLVAAGPWTAPLVRRLGVALPLHAERHVVAVLDPGAAGVAVPFVLVDVDAGYYSAPQTGGRAVLGPLGATPPVPPDTVPGPLTDPEFAVLADAYRTRVPSPVRSRRAGGWTALYDVSPDWQPVIGQVSERVYVDAGTSGHGFKLAPSLSGHVAALVAGEEPSAGLARLHPRRFTEGEPLAAGFGAARILG